MTKARVWITGTEAEGTVEDLIDQALDTAAQYEGGRTIICRGGSLCCEPEDSGSCPWCYVVHHEDEREPEDIVTDMMRPVRH